MQRLAMCLILATCALVEAAPRRAMPKSGQPAMFTATAYSLHGRTADGSLATRGTAAANPSVIPLGSTVKVTGAGSFSGIYRVTDTGRRIGRRTIDLFTPSSAAARKFGRKQVHVQVLRVGDGRR